MTRIVLNGDTIMAIKHDITEIKVAIGKVEQHLSDINGRIKRHEKYLSDKCPAKHKDLDNSIDLLKQETWKNTTKIGIGIIILNGLVMFLLQTLL